MKEYIIELHDDDVNAEIRQAYSVQELVRCRDCVHGRVYAPNCVDCELNELAKDEDFFCADGVRKND